MHNEASLGDVTGAGASLRHGRGFCELWPRFKAFGDDLVGRHSIKDTLTPDVVGGIEASKQLLKIAVRVDGNAQHLTADAAIEAFDHAIRLRCTGSGVSIGRTELCAGLLESWCEATTVIGQHVSEPERKGCCGFPQEGNGTLLGFIILDRQMHGTGSPVDGNKEVALASFAISGLQLG